MIKTILFVALSSLVTLSAYGQGVRKDDIVLNSRGQALAGATVRICTAAGSGQPCTPLASIYADLALTQAMGNPLTADSLGNYFFYAAPGRYLIEISGTGIVTRQIANVLLPGDPGAGIAFTAIVTKTAAYTLTAADFAVNADATAGAFSVTLPAASGALGRLYWVTKTDASTNTITLATTGSDTIAGASSFVLATRYKFIGVQSTGSGWNVIAKPEMDIDVSLFPGSDMNAKLNAAVAACPNPGCRLKLPCGTYPVSTQARIPIGVDVGGCGSTLVDAYSGTKLAWTGSALSPITNAYTLTPGTMTLSRSAGSLVTANLAAGHGIAAGDVVEAEAENPTDWTFMGLYQVATATATTFTYQQPSGAATNSATPTNITAGSCAVGIPTPASIIATITAAGHGLSAGQVGVVTGVTPAQYNTGAQGAYITSTTANTVSYMVSSCATYTSGGTVSGRITINRWGQTFTTVARAGSTVTVATPTAPNLAVKDWVFIYCATAGSCTIGTDANQFTWTGARQVTSVVGNTFTFDSAGAAGSVTPGAAAHLITRYPGVVFLDGSQTVLSASPTTTLHDFTITSGTQANPAVGSVGLYIQGYGQGQVNLDRMAVSPNVTVYESGFALAGIMAGQPAESITLPSGGGIQLGLKISTTSSSQNQGAGVLAFHSTPFVINDYSSFVDNGTTVGGSPGASGPPVSTHRRADLILGAGDIASPPGLTAAGNWVAQVRVTDSRMTMETSTTSNIPRVIINNAYNVEFHGVIAEFDSPAGYFMDIRSVGSAARYASSINLFGGFFQGNGQAGLYGATQYAFRITNPNANIGLWGVHVEGLTATNCAVLNNVSSLSVIMHGVEMSGCTGMVEVAGTTSNLSRVANVNSTTPPGTVFPSVPFGGVVYVTPQSAGADFGAKIANALAAAPATGVVIDATAFTGTQAIASTLTLNKPVTLLVHHTLNALCGGAANPCVTDSSDDVQIKGTGVFETGTATIRTVTPGNVVFQSNSGTIAQRSGLVVEAVQFQNNSAATARVVDLSYTNYVQFNRVLVKKDSGSASLVYCESKDAGPFAYYNEMHSVLLSGGSGGGIGYDLRCNDFKIYGGNVQAVDNIFNLSVSSPGVGSTSTDGIYAYGLSAETFAVSFLTIPVTAGASVSDFTFFGGRIESSTAGAKLFNILATNASGIQVISPNIQTAVGGGWTWGTINSTDVAVKGVSTLGLAAFSGDPPILAPTSRQQASGAKFSLAGALGRSLDFGMLTEITTVAAAAFTDTTIQIPANAVVLAVSVYVSTAIPTAATFDVGVAGFTTRYGTGICSGLGCNNPGSNDGTRFYSAATSVRLSPNLVPGTSAGRVRVTIYYYLPVAPTS